MVTTAVFHLYQLIDQHDEMTVRDKVQQQSPDGNVLLLEDLRRYLGLEANTGHALPSAEVDEGPLKVILLGHDMRGDFPNMKKAGIDISQHLHYAGCGDTHIWIEDTKGPLPLGLSALIDHYRLARCHHTQTLRKGPKWVFIGAHNAGNDAVMTIQLALAQALDQGLHSKGGKALELEDPERLNQSLHGMDVGMILLAYDTESATNARYATSVLNRTTEHGFAWLRLADVVSIAPGPSGVNWYTHIQARHWINKDLKDYKNRDYCVGNPHGFWEQYGKSLYYTDKDGPAPFQTLFKELAGDQRVEEAAAAIQSLALGSLDFPSLSDATPQMGVFSRVPVPEKINNNNIKRPAEGKELTGGKAWARGLPGGRAQGVRDGSRQGGGHASTTATPSTKDRPAENASTASKDSAAVSDSTTSPKKATTAVSDDKTATSSTTATPKVTSSWAQITRGR